MAVVRNVGNVYYLSEEMLQYANEQAKRLSFFLLLILYYLCDVM